MLLIIVFSGLLSYAQESKVYTANRTAWYIYNENTKDWDLQSENTDVNIDIVVFKNVINIQAKTPSLFRLDEDSKRQINTENLAGLRYSAIECVDMQKCTVDIVASKNTDSRVFVLLITYNKDIGKVNLRYYATYND